tara:strand:+ start:754 stop:897 length:144 start_codon:yes stop_codon:yes gene_type:complete
LETGDISISSPLSDKYLREMTWHFEIEDENFGFNESNESNESEDLTP